MIQLAQLYQDLEAQVIQQEPAVTRIEQQGEEVNDHVAKGTSPPKPYIPRERQDAPFYPPPPSHPDLVLIYFSQYRARWRCNQGAFG